MSVERVELQPESSQTAVVTYCDLFTVNVSRLRERDTSG